MERFLPSKERPFMIMRFRRGQVRPELWARTFEVLKSNRGCCDEVWFSTGVGFPLLSEHQEFSGYMAVAAEQLRAVGIIPSLQIQTTLGHSDRIIAAPGAPAKTWGSYVGKHGEVCQFVNCPRQAGFLEYIRRMCEIYAEWHPGSVWIDDDLRLNNHAPAMDAGGCYCKDCLALFSREEGKDYTREELVLACDKDPQLAERWYRFGERSICGVARVIAEVFHEKSPETRMGLQHCDELWRLAVLKTLRDASGKRVGSRPGGGAYSDAQPFELLDKGVGMSLQKYQQFGYDVLDQVCPEVESCPRVLACKTSQGHRIESLFYLAMGMDSLSYFIIAPNLETPEWYGKNLLAPLAAETPAYQEYIRCNEGTEGGGVGVFGYCRQKIEDLGLPLVGIPFAGASPRSSCWVVSGECARRSSDSDLRKHLAGNIIVSGEAAVELAKRGFGEFLGGVHAEEQTAVATEIYAGHPLCAEFENQKYIAFFQKTYFFTHPKTADFQVLSKFLDEGGREYGAGMVLFQRADGTRVALVGAGFAMHYMSSSRVQVLTRVSNWVSGGTLPVLCEEPMQVVLVPRLDENGNLRSVMVLNPTIGPMTGASLILRSVPAGVNHVTWQVPAESPVELPLEAVKGGWRVGVPGLAAWNLGTLLIGN